FLVFLLIYLITPTGNLLILLLIFTDSHLHSPMYFFLGTLAGLDMSYSSVTVPRILFDLLRERKIISVQVCITQIYFFVFFITSEMSVMAVMSYDRYIAICRPLHYMQIMNWNVCVQFESGALLFSTIYSLVHTLFLTKLTFCLPNVLQSFFCDIPQLLEVSCSDTFINVLLIFLLGILFATKSHENTEVTKIPKVEVLKQRKDLKLQKELKNLKKNLCNRENYELLMSSLEMNLRERNKKTTKDKDRRRSQSDASGEDNDTRSTEKDTLRERHRGKCY
ncbi:olfactory receptor 1J2-like, partial [Xenopus laevis]|uniref:Olfactory receptor 1J2-like n=1 Tax=Xenopus laevis TaxID=8355 RepID=A0A8J1LU53_XENLA